jgi:hypothetical protein
VVQFSAERPSLRNAWRTAASTSARSGDFRWRSVSTSAPSRSTRRATSCEPDQITSSSVASSGAPASRAVASSTGAASRIRALAIPGARSATAMASHVAPANGESGDSSAAVPPAMR